jgi:hypothetical protein
LGNSEKRLSGGIESCKKEILSWIINGVANLIDLRESAAETNEIGTSSVPRLKPIKHPLF